jgi:hypothetical protein
MVIVAPATVPLAVSGGLALLDLSCCAKINEVINNPINVNTSPFENVFFIVCKFKFLNKIFGN